MTKPLVSVIIPCYNHIEYLGEAVESVLASTYENIEIIVINDGSIIEGSNEFFMNFSMPKTKVLHQENQGLPGARNTGVKNSNGKYILPLDADDLINKNFIQKAVGVLENNGNIGIVGPTTELFGVQSGIFDLPKYKFSDILNENCLVCSCLYRRDDWVKTGGYNTNMVYGLEDWDFWLSIIELGREVYQFDEVMFYYRKHNKSMVTSLTSREKRHKMYAQVIKNHWALYQQHNPRLINCFCNDF